VRYFVSVIAVQFKALSWTKYLPLTFWRKQRLIFKYKFLRVLPIPLLDLLTNFSDRRLRKSLAIIVATPPFCEEVHRNREEKYWERLTGYYKSYAHLKH